MTHFAEVNKSGVNARTIHPNPALSEGPSDRQTVLVALEAGSWPRSRRIQCSDGAAAAARRVAATESGRRWLYSVTCPPRSNNYWPKVYGPHC